ncbi:MAG: DUF1156 domain-containing protein, partial [Candidatus Binatia bacterium]
MPKHLQKLIEVALPLDAINKASAREKSIHHGHPSTLHLWWARRPLAAARAVIFAQMVDDPSAHPDQFSTEEAQEKERQRLFRLIEELVLWENTTNETVLAQAREEIWKSWRRTCEEHEARSREHEARSREQGARSEEGDASSILASCSSLPASSLFNPDKLPAFHDPFAGGGSLPLEAQRLGLESYASDLNPVAVLINKAMIEIPPKFAGRPPVNPETRRASCSSLLASSYRGAQGLAEDVRYYGQWMRDEAEKRIGHLYLKIEITKEMAKERLDLKPLVGKKLTVIAWLWARTVKSPNPAFAQVDVPLASTFMLSTKAGKEAYVEPILTSSPLAGEGEETSPLGPLSLTGEGKAPLLPDGRRGQGDEVAESQGARKFYGITSNAAVSVEKLNLARRMRKLPTEAEAKAWALLRDRHCLGLKFRRQQVIRGLIVDFYCAEKRLALELDGPIHDQQREYDQQRDAILGAEEITVLRIPNERLTPAYLTQQIQDYLIPLTPSSRQGEGGEKREGEEKEGGKKEEDEVPSPSPVTERELEGEVPDRVDEVSLAAGGTGAAAYADAVAVYLAFALDKVADRGSSI